MRPFSERGDGSFDYYSFTTIAPSIIQIDVDSSPVFTNFDIEVDLWNAAGTFLAGNDDGGLDAGDDGTNLVGGAFNSRFSTGVLPAGTYLVGVSTFPSSGLNGGGISGNGATGNYTLHISAIANPEPATILLFGLGAMVAGGYEVRRRRKVA